MSCSTSHAIAITDKGYAYGWGCNKYYQLGLGKLTKYENLPQRLYGSLNTKFLKSCCVSDKTSALITDKGEVWTFGTSE